MQSASITWASSKAQLKPEWFYEDKLDKIPNYELLNYILCNSAYVIKWNRNASNISGHCKHVENIHHLIVEFKTVHDIWRSAGNMLSFQIK